MLVVTVAVMREVLRQAMSVDAGMRALIDVMGNVYPTVRLKV